jgi:hypothetical protein
MIGTMISACMTDAACMVDAAYAATATASR